MPSIPVKILCGTTQLLASFCGMHAKSHGVIGLSKHYNLQLYTKLGNGKFSIRRILCVCIACTTMLDKPWAYTVNPTKHPCYQTVDDCTYWPVLDSLNNWNVIQFAN